MIFRTEITPPPSGLKLRPPQAIAWTGSCFAEKMAERLARHRFSCASPSHGILFHPLAIAASLNQVMDGMSWSRADLTEHNGVFHSLSHHGSYADQDAERLLSRIQSETSTFRNALSNARVIIITLGTAQAWIGRASGDVVANCHKLPADRFATRMFTSGEIIQSLSDSLLRLREHNPGIDVVISVSPVRHWRQGYAANQLSKSHLLIAAHGLAEQHDFVHYFPAYELFMDDLRDYRFYDKDLVHPSDQGVDYVWEKFADWAIDPAVRDQVNQIGRLSRIFDHIPSGRREESHDELKARTEGEIAELVRRISAETSR